MKAEIITIGDELLLGQVIDTNSSWLGQELNKLGIHVHHKSAISDKREAILDALSQASKRSSIVIITGGLGPTKDDITKFTMCEFFQTNLVLNQRVLDWVTEIFSKRNLPMIDSNMQQAMLPTNCELLWNRSGTAPGMWFYENDVAYVSMPGVPFEMKTIFEEEVIPMLKKTFSFPAIVHRTIQTCSIGESFLAKKIEDIEDQLPNHIKLAYLPSVGAVRLRFSAYGENELQLHDELNHIINKLYDRIGHYIYGEGNDSLQEVVGALLNSQSKTLATAESCTGGYMAHLITSVPGSSNYYLGSVIAYHNKIKMEQLNVPESLLIEHGAVSEACVIKMAEEVRLKTGADYAISSSGIAGPGGGTETKPVGTVWIGFASESKSFGRVFNMGDNRERTILRTALMALDILRKELLED